MAKNKITKKQSEILEFIKQEILDRGFPPSVREICKAVDLRSTSSVHAHLNSLEKLGYIKRDPAKPRCIIVVDEVFNDMRTKVVNVPIIGTISAGLPILAVENMDGYFPLPTEVVPDDCQTFMLRIKGESMKNAGILDKDLILVRQQNTAENGDYVVALIGDTVTCKTFYREKDYIRLQPENEIFSPIITDVCQILGKVIGLFRTF